MILEGLTIACGLLTAFDAWLTRKRMYAYGINVELNRWVKHNCHLFGIELGLVIGQLFPIFVLLSILYSAHLEWVLAFIVGMKFKLFHNQLISIVFEKQLIAAAKIINEQNANLDGDADSTLQSAPSQSEEPSQSPSTNSKDDNESV